jgi:hypothetical protein
MNFGSSEDTIQAPDRSGMEPASISMFPGNGQFETTEQIRGFELLRLAFFVLKLRKLEQRHEHAVEEDSEYAFRKNLLHHVIFHQILTLTELQARDQALQLIEVCRK